MTDSPEDLGAMTAGLPCERALLGHQQVGLYPLPPRQDTRTRDIALVTDADTVSQIGIGTFVRGERYAVQVTHLIHSIPEKGVNISISCNGGKPDDLIVVISRESPTVERGSVGATPGSSKRAEVDETCGQAVRRVCRWQIHYSS